jgi:5-methylcytosine-specific restriction endonuclease McrA
VDITLHYFHPLSATLDHIIPQSHMLIPDHSDRNLRLAHRSCNSARGDRLEAA